MHLLIQLTFDICFLRLITHPTFALTFPLPSLPSDNTKATIMLCLYTFQPTKYPSKNHTTKTRTQLKSDANLELIGGF